MTTGLHHDCNVGGELAALREENKELRQQVELLKKDKERLDWLDGGSDYERFERHLEVEVNYTAMGAGRKYRMAINATMAQHQKGE